VLPVLLTFIVGKYATRFDLRLLTSGAFVVMGATCFLRSDFYIGVDFQSVALVQLLQGLGVALFFMPVTTILLSDLQPNEIASGGGVATFLRTMGASFSASLTSFMWQRRGVLHHAQLTEQITPYNPTVQQALGQTSDTSTAVAVLNQSITLQGLQISFNEIFHVLGWVFMSLIVVIWMAKPPFAAKAGAAGGGH
jgi:DHA2 family multidrug resistance protein